MQSSKLIKLLGARYNPSTSTAKMSCEMYATPAQNKRHLCDLLTRLLAEAKDPADTFEDVPFDFRYHTPKKTHAFPEHWKMTPQRREMLDAARERSDAAEMQRLGTGQVVEGRGVIELMLAGGGGQARSAERVPVMAAAGGRPASSSSADKRAGARPRATPR